MSIISKETFDKFSEEEKESVRKFVSELNLGRALNDKSGTPSHKHQFAIDKIEELFGKENLQPEPKIKTWEDVEKLNKIFNDTDIFFTHPNINWIWGEKVVNKCIATLKIAKLIELGYGGVISNEEWLNEENPKYVIKCTTDIKPRLYNDEVYDDIQFVAFHTDKQRNEFMSYAENVDLIRQYYML